MAPGPDRELAAYAANAFAQATGIACAWMPPTGDAAAMYAACAAGPDAQGCLKAHRAAYREARRAGGKCIYLCPEGFAYIVAPIAGEGGLLAGPFLLTSAEEYIACELDGDARSAAADFVRTLPGVTPARATALADMLMMAAAFLAGAEEISRLRDTQQSDHIQGQVSDYLSRIKHRQAPYPFDKEQELLDMMAQGRRKEANRLLNELLGHILLISGMSFGRMKSRINELIVLMSRKAVETGADAALIQEEVHRSFDRLSRISGFEELCFWLTGVMNSLISAAFDAGVSRHQGAVRRAVSFIRSHLEERITLEQVSEAAFLSPDYFSRVFRRETGATVEQFIRNERMKRSAELMRRGGLTLGEIAQAVGNKSQSQFSRMFRETYGIPPGRHMKRLRDRSRAASG